jgi:hypothetical protein
MPQKLWKIIEEATGAFIGGDQAPIIERIKGIPAR